MRTRQDIEKLEQENLASYAMKSVDSKGRHFDEPKHPVRTCYQRDRDRIVHSEAFRKLEYKTQVFVIFEGDYYRTRLTHTIEVAQIARTIGRSLALNEDLIEAIALAHDLGHPPFGHAGEDALNRLISNHDLKFNHNYRSYEIVSSLEKRYPDFSGLNLTHEVNVGILKHETTYDVAENVEYYKKMGPTLEAKVVDIADALAYLSHDIDDGITSGCITADDLMESKLFRNSYKKINAVLKDADKGMLKYQLVKFLIDIQTRDLLEHSVENLNKLKFASSEEVKAYHLNEESKDKADRFAVISFSSEMAKERGDLQELLKEKLYHHYRVERMTSKAKRIIDDLFGVYIENPEQLPYEHYNRQEKYSDQQKHEIVCNYIASMTDRTALDEHKRLFNPYQKV